MEYRKLGNSDIEVSAVGFGCWQIGGYYWGRVDEAEWIAAVHRALDSGITLFDTADWYGFGRSEELLAKALGPRRDEAVIATKVGLTMRGDRHDFASNELLELEDHIEKDLSRGHIMQAAADSLRRLQTDVIDLYLLHWPDVTTPPEETMEAMGELVQAGKVREVGCCNFSVSEMREAHSHRALAVHQFPYNMLNREPEQELLPACQDDNISTMAYWTLFKGMLTGKYTEDSVFETDDWRHHDPAFQGDTFKRSLQIVEKLKQVADDEAITPAQLAIAWAIRPAGATTAIVGAKRPQQAEQNAKAADVQLSDVTLARIEDILSGE